MFQVDPIMEKYGSYSDIPAESEENRILSLAIDRAEVLETVMIKNIIKKHGNMLGHFQKILDEAVYKARERIDELSQTVNNSLFFFFHPPETATWNTASKQYNSSYSI
jgi:hypothetical protein